MICSTIFYKEVVMVLLVLVCYCFAALFTSCYILYLNAEEYSRIKKKKSTVKFFHKNVLCLNLRVVVGQQKIVQRAYVSL